MATVRILPEILSNQIAAGEVVERPVSVVKELVENSIDADASHITIEIVNGGKSLIRVSDDGMGMSREDALLSIERYATSKLYDQKDLFSISTMGFRGEALPSIASVARFALETRSKLSPVGTRIEIAGGRLKDVSDAGAPVGTMVEVRHLFFNTPARKKFLKSDKTENSHIADILSSIALANPGIQFKLIVNNRLYKNYPLSNTLMQRTIDVLGKEISQRAYEISYSDATLKVSGYCVNPSLSRRSASKIFLFVNHRLIHDRGLVSAVLQGYEGRIMKGRFPLALIFVKIEYDQVDVNVHPSKREIRFFQHQPVYNAVTLAVRNALRNAQQDMTHYSQSSAPQSYKRGKSISYPFVKKDQQTLEVKQSLVKWVPKASDLKPEAKIPVEPEAGYADRFKLESSGEASILDDMRIVGQMMGTYILCEKDEKMILIDQHAAHERIVYESIKKRFLSLNIVSQQLVVPETIEVNHKESVLLETMLEKFMSIGVNIAPFGGNTFVVKAVPALLSQKEARSFILDVLEAELAGGTQLLEDAWFDDALTLMACHAAVRAHKSMAMAEMEKLLSDLVKCDNPMHCPHGRPTLVILTKTELEKRFKRIV